MASHTVPHRIFLRKWVVKIVVL